MDERHGGTVTALLQQIQAGRQGAADKLMEIIYDELHSVAKRFMAQVPPSDTLQPTAPVP